jgi:putative transcriptional regulator
MDYFGHQENRKPAKGDLLISEPFLPDPNFERTVVLLCEHNDQGSFGFVLNKPSILKFSDVMDESSYQELLYVGGPVEQDTLHVLHTQGNLLEGSVDLGNGIFWGGNFEQLQLLADTQQIEPANFKFFLGYSGWSIGQLEMELKEKTWIISNQAQKEQVFDMDAEQLWKNVLNEMGGKFKMISNYPIDPRLN